MAEDRNTIKEYDQQHGTPKGAEPKELDTAPSASPQHNRPLPVAPKSGGVG